MWFCLLFGAVVFVCLFFKSILSQEHLVYYGFVWTRKTATVVTMSAAIGQKKPFGLPSGPGYYESRELRIRSFEFMLRTEASKSKIWGCWKSSLTQTIDWSSKNEQMHDLLLSRQCSVANRVRYFGGWCIASSMLVCFILLETFSLSENRNTGISSRFPPVWSILDYIIICWRRRTESRSFMF